MNLYIYICFSEIFRNCWSLYGSLCSMPWRCVPSSCDPSILKQQPFVHSLFHAQICSVRCSWIFQLLSPAKIHVFSFSHSRGLWECPVDWKSQPRYVLWGGLVQKSGHYVELLASFCQPDRVWRSGLHGFESLWFGASGNDGRVSVGCFFLFFFVKFHVTLPSM